MSENIKEAAEQAYATVVTQLAAPYFFEKLAAHGITPGSEGEAAEMWTAAQKLHVLYTAEQEKTAAARHSGLAAVNQQLDAVLAAATGTDGGDEKQAAFYDVAALAAGRPEIADAVLTLQAAAAAAMQSAE
jgi:hypothetical protein